MTTEKYNPQTGRWEHAIPEPYYHGLLRWAWLRLTGYRDADGRKARLLWERTKPHD
jgi:hypothetical protein